MDALAPGAEEGRGIAAISRGEGPSTRDTAADTRMGQPTSFGWYPDNRGASGGTETSKYPEEQRAFPE